LQPRRAIVKACARTIVLILAAVAGLCVAQSPAGAAEKDVWGPLQFLVGTWLGVGSGQPGEAMTGSTTFSYELDRNVLVRKNRAEYPPKAGQKTGQVHEDLLIVYPQPGGKGFGGIYFDNEGHVINYTVSLPSKQSSVAFDSESGEKSSRFRLVYEMTKEGLLSVEFLVAPPGGELKSYTKGVLKRQE
jgi:hypothetical protein